MATNHVTPGQARHLRACMVCSIVQLQSRFLREGCPNCDSILQMTNDPDMVAQSTSQVYEGLITVANPAESWVAKWQRIDKYVPGVYAVKVVGSLNGNVIQMLEDNGIRYVPRDGSQEEEV